MIYRFRAYDTDLRMNKSGILSMQISPKFSHSLFLDIQNFYKADLKGPKLKVGQREWTNLHFSGPGICLLNAYCLTPLFFHPHYANGEVCVGDLCRYIHTVLTTELTSPSSAKTAKPTTCAWAVQIHSLSKFNGSDWVTRHGDRVGGPVVLACHSK